MNKDRRKQIEVEKADIEKAISAIEDALANLESIRDDEQEYLDNMPENMQQGDKGDAATEAISNLDEAIEALQDLVDADVPATLDSAAE